MKKSVFSEAAKKLIPFVALCCITVSGAFAADAAPMELPDQFSFHISIRSPRDLISAVDGYVANSTKDTANPVPAGIVAMLAQMYFPIPFDMWHADSGVHLLLLREAHANVGEVVVFSADGFDSFIEGLEDIGAEVSEFDKDNPKVLPASKAKFTLDGFTAYAAELQDGRIAVTRNPVSFILGFTKSSTASTVWLPKDHEGDSDIRIVSSPDFTALQPTAERTERMIEDLADKLAENGVERTVADGLAEGFADGRKQLLGELDLLERVGIDVWLDDEWLRIGSKGDWKDGALAKEAADMLAGKNAVENPLAERVRSDALSITVNAPADTMVRDGSGRAAAFLAEALAHAFPDKKDALGRNLARVFAYAAGGYVEAKYQRGEDMGCNAIWFRTGEPEGVKSAVAGFFQDMNEMWGQAFVDEAYHMRFDSEPGSAEGVSYDRYFPVFKNREKIREAMDDWLIDHPFVPHMLTDFENASVFLGVKDGVALLAVGTLTADDYAAIWRENAGGALIKQRQAQAIQSKLPFRQTCFGFLSVDRFFDSVAPRLLTRQNILAVDPLYARAFAKMPSLMEDTGEGCGFSIGADGGRLVLDWVMPASAVNAGIRHYELLERIKGKIENGEFQDEEDGEAENVEEEPVETSSKSVDDLRTGARG